MKPTTIMLSSVLMLAMAGMPGCATTAPSAPGNGSVRMTQQAGDLAFQLRRQALTFREQAQRYELETAALAALKGLEHEDTVRSRELAKTFSAAADEADQTAREYRQHIPHNRLY